MDITDDGLRLLSNLAGHYDAWLQAMRVVDEGRLQWKTSGDREYLYRIIDRNGNGTSLGPRSAETETLREAYEIAKQTVECTWSQLQIEGRMYRALRLPRVPSYGAAALRQLDLDTLLGTSVLVVGTNALAAYAIEAGVLTPSELDATEDFDLSWVGASAHVGLASRTVFGALKEVDGTYTINTERTFRARNAAGNEVELLIANDVASTLPKYEKLRPIPLPEQSWLLPGRRVSHVVCGLDGRPARIVAPDPRWFALHKLWLANKPSRDPLKKGKDQAQGRYLLDLVADRMPHFALDGEFEQQLPAELRPYYEGWRKDRPQSSQRSEVR